ncbi:phosphate/phosphite/phosphonate ABC transporter substrate-binding protein [Alkalimonas sp. MEB108]|uniref:Phosphate/phosphite/phosphonate ABC transporter substrate-binding protein n=1 Tax=Alkalimonas cellulosilytica TaxID=3058395 RepID=A0ABU7J233_9GAMM|nr:phosphate/phosphite/phosphonate ABC transporter substrate-binding protein [Alkalimonas sp. MEB108]MEE2000531.1 phosphate/phosphite/phosphonate ABC transporter substrate-binding protein [Alkalimonas sp. MEB108]
MRSGLKVRMVSSLFWLSTMLLLAGCQPKGELGSRDNPVRLYFTPSVDADTIASNSREFIRFLEQETGDYYVTGIPTSYIAVVEAFGSGRADIGAMNSFGYLMANERYGARAHLKMIRHGVDYYQGQIVVRADSGIETLADLEGRRFAFTDPASTSGYFFPLKMLRDAGIRLGNETFAMKHDNVITMVYQGQVDAGSAYYSAPAADGSIRDARQRVLTQFPDVEQQVRILAVTEKIPNDPFVFRKDLPDEIRDRFISAVKKFLASDEGQDIFRNIYSVEGLVDASDADYDPLREMIRAIELDTNRLLL